MQPGTIMIRNVSAGHAPPERLANAALNNAGTNSGARIRPVQVNRMVNRSRVRRRALESIHTLPDDADEPGAKLLVKPPDHFVFAFLGYAVAGEEQHEFVGNVVAVDMEPHAAIGNIHDDTFARRRAVAELDPGHTIERTARLPSPLMRLQRKHDPAPCCGPLSAIGDSTRRPNTYLTTISRSLTRALGFASYLPEIVCSAESRYAPSFSSATNHRPWRMRRPSASPARCRSGGRSSRTARRPVRS